MRVLVSLVIAALILSLFLGLGFWQIKRLTWKQGVLTAIEARISDAPAEIPLIPTEARDKYMPVRIDGTVGREEIDVLVSHRRFGAGYRIISVLETGGRRVLLDRGFTRLEGKDAERVTGPIKGVGNLHWPDDLNASTPVPDLKARIWFARDIPAMAAHLGTEPVLIIARDMSPEDPSLTPLPVTTAGIPNDHLQYALTWFSMAVLWVITTVAILRRWRRQAKG